MKDSISRIWMYKYSLTCEYFKEHGNLLIPRNYSLEVNGNIVNLGSWLNKQRQYYKENKLNNEQISLLNEIGMIWRLNKAKESKNDELSYNWMKNYELAKKYYEEHDNLLIPQKYYLTINDEK